MLFRSPDRCLRNGVKRKRRVVLESEGGFWGSGSTEGKLFFLSIIYKNVMQFRDLGGPRSDANGWSFGVAVFFKESICFHVFYIFLLKKECSINKLSGIKDLLAY